MERPWSCAGSVRVMRGAAWGPKLMNRCRPEKKVTKEYGNMFETNPHTEKKEGFRTGTREGGKLKRRKEESPGSRENSKLEVSHGNKKDFWDIAKQRMVEERRPLPNEEGNWVSEYKAVYKEIVLSSWLMEDVEGKAGVR